MRQGFQGRLWKCAAPNYKNYIFMRANIIYLFPWTLRGIFEGSWLRPKERGRLTPQQASDPPIPPPPGAGER